MKGVAPLTATLTVTPLPESEVEISGEIAPEAIQPYRAQALKHLGEHAEIAGFRKGHVPDKILIERYGEPAILFEAAELALSELYPNIIREKELNVIGRPEITLTKLAPGNPIGFKIKTALMPEVSLPDYKTIAKNALAERENIEVTEEEIASTIKEIQKRQAEALKTETGTAEEPSELTDAYVQSLGKFKDVADFKAQLKENMQQEKSARAREKKRIEISDRIIESSTITLPRILIESELEKMLGQFKEDLSRMNLGFETYLKRIKKTEEELRKDWEGDAAKRAKLQLILNHIAKNENLAADPEMVNHEVDHIKEHIKDADPERLRLYVETMLTNEKVFQFLEDQGSNKKVTPA